MKYCFKHVVSTNCLFCESSISYEILCILKYLKIILKAYCKATYCLYVWRYWSISFTIPGSLTGSPSWSSRWTARWPWSTTQMLPVSSPTQQLSWAMFRFSCIFGHPRPIHSITLHSSQNVVKWNSQACVSKDGFHEDLQKLGASFYQNIICNTQHLFLKRLQKNSLIFPSYLLRSPSF